MFSYFTKSDNQRDLFYQIKNEFEKCDTIMQGWYIIFKDDICVYVGQSKNLPSRIATHLKGKYENCDTILVFENYEVDEKLDITEQYLMNIFKPLENKLVDFSKKINYEEIAECNIYFANEDPNIEGSITEKIIKYSNFSILNYKRNIFIENETILDLYENNSLSNKMKEYIQKSIINDCVRVMR